MKKKKKRS